MRPFETLTSTLAPLPHRDVDTDQIIPAQYLKVTTKEGLEEGLFSRWRTLADGTPDPEFFLNRRECQGAQILLAGDNFGCGSSREHAPWALQSHGIRAIISASFADIFRNNALKNGLLPVVVDEATSQQLFSLVSEEPEMELTIDLRAQTVTLPDGRLVNFPMDAFSRHCLLHGVDQLGFLLKQEARITAFERARAA